MINASKTDMGKIKELRERLSDVEPLPASPQFHVTDDTLLRYLRSRDMSVSDAEKMLRQSVEWRRSVIPSTVKCDTCVKQPGAHSMRQIGYDLLRRPIIYTSFTQASLLNISVADVTQHTLHTIENAIKCMVPGVSQWILFVDCSGMNVASCSPKLGYEITQILSNHYPERLAHAFCLRPSSAFKAALGAIKRFMPTVTAKKVHLMKLESTEKKFTDQFKDYFDEATIAWLYREVTLNGKKVITSQQKQFWQPNNTGDHDPRGTKEYVDDILNNTFEGFEPHPNITQSLLGETLQLVSSSSKEDVASSSGSVDDDEDLNDSVAEDLQRKFEQSLCDDIDLTTSNAASGPKINT